jgi:GTP-binding protein Era
LKKNEDKVETYCGYVAIVGRPNVGKSTLLNHLLRQKLSITSRKPQTTRHRIIGVTSGDHHQCVFVDTPGLHSVRRRALNRVMNETVISVINDVDAVIFVVERLSFNQEDHKVLDLLREIYKPVFLVINKTDKIRQKDLLLPHMNQLSSLFNFSEIIPASALGGHNLDRLEKVVKSCLPRGQFLFPKDQFTDRSMRFFASELIREKITRQLGDELPYDITVEIEKFTEEEGFIDIHGLILIDRSGQKKNHHWKKRCEIEDYWDRSSRRYGRGIRM